MSSVVLFRYCNLNNMLFALFPLLLFKFCAIGQRIQRGYSHHTWEKEIHSDRWREIFAKGRWPSWGLCRFQRPELRGCFGADFDQRCGAIFFALEFYGVARMDSTDARSPSTGRPGKLCRGLLQFLRFTNVFGLSSAPAAVLAVVSCRLNQGNI